MSDLVRPGRGRDADLSDVGRLHRFVMGLFGTIDSDEPRSAGGILFRTEHVARRSRLLIQSGIKPEPDQRLSVKDASALLETIAEGTRVQLRLTVNPVRRDSKTKADKPLTAESELQTWIAAKLENGFDSLEILNLTTGTLRCGKLRIATATVDAQARVLDGDRCVELVRSGVGRRKSHGCGLLSVIPVAGSLP